MKLKNLKQAVILAGGLGERLKPLTDKIPKPMVNINGFPFIKYMINYLSSEGIKEVVLLTGYKSEILEDYLGDGSDYGLKIKFSKLDKNAQTSKRIFNAREFLQDNFLLLYCDNFIPLKLADLENQYFSLKKLALLSVYSNKFLMTNNNIQYLENKIINYDEKRLDDKLNGVNIGYMILNKATINLFENTNQNFESILINELIKTKQLSCYVTNHKYYSIGSIDRLPVTEKYFSKNKYILLDRDGVLNKKMAKAQYVRNWKEWEWKKGSLEALKILNDINYKVILISNQPGVARGFMTDKDLDDIHKKMKNEINNFGGSIDSIYVCKCNWDDNCYCRKPNPGMIFKAQYDNDFVLSDTYFIGDDERDMEAAKRAGCKGILIRGNDKLDIVVKNLFIN